MVSSSSDDIIDIRDMIERFEELRDERADLETAFTDAQKAFEETDEEDGDARAEAQVAIDDAESALLEWDGQEEHDNLKSLLEDLAGSGGDEKWEGSWYPITLVADSHFEDFARDEAEQLGLIKDQSWPCNCIDWERAARELQMDYSAVEWGGNTFWYR